MMSAVPSATSGVTRGVAVVGSGGQLRSQRRQRGVVAGWVKMMMMMMMMTMTMMTMMRMMMMMTMNMDIIMIIMMQYLVVLWGR